MKYIKKPIPIEAEQWFPGTPMEGVEEVILGDEVPKTVGRLQTLNGLVYIEPGEWVLTGVNDEKYPCKDDIFKATYEKASV